MGPVALNTAGELLERTEELALLAECLDSVRRDSRGRVVLVSGEAGVGKTALLRRFCEDHGSSARILWGGCDPLFVPRPLGPLLAIGEAAGGELEAVVAGSDVMAHEVVAAFARGVRGPTIFVLEDVHWADEATLDVLRLLARRVETIPVLVVATYRDDELDRAHPLRLVVGELATSEHVTRRRLSPLSPSAVAQLADPHGFDTDELFRKTGGNPFFVVEALAAGPDEIPATVRDAVFARAARLDPVATRLLEAVAVVPPRGELWLLEALDEDAVERLEECLGSGMLESAPGSVAFRHELARLAIEESISLKRKVDLHRRSRVRRGRGSRAAPNRGTRRAARAPRSARAVRLRC